MAEKNNFNNFELSGIIFNKALMGCDLTEEQAEFCVKYCRVIRSSKITHPANYQKWITSIKSILKKNGFSAEECTKFVNTYIEESVFETGEPHFICVSPDISDINMYRRALAVFYKQIVVPRTQSLMQKGEPANVRNNR